jgi:antitoxin component YwqK of YwqJK toxin-antitoxin module
MKQLASVLMTLTFLIAVSCGSGTGDTGKGKDKAKHEPDTGYTGVRSYIKDDIKVKEVEFKNGVKEGMTRTFYKGGVVEQEIMYRDGKKNGEARWYYPDSKLFRVTPYVNDTISGSQIQYYKNGRVKARLDYADGRRMPGLEEYNMDGTKITDYPTLQYRAVDQYSQKGIVKFFIEMSDLSENVRYYRGDLVDGLVDLTLLTPLMQTATTGYLDMKKTPGQSADSVAVVAAFLTGFGNRLYYPLSIPLPYKDLN